VVDTRDDPFAIVTFRILSGKIYTRIAKQLPRVYRDFLAGDTCGLAPPLNAANPPRTGVTRHNSVTCI